MTMKNVDELLEAMLDAVIEVTARRKGFLLLLEDADGPDGSPLREGSKPLRPRVPQRAARRPSPTRRARSPTASSVASSRSAARSS